MVHMVFSRMQEIVLYFVEFVNLGWEMIFLLLSQRYSHLSNKKKFHFSKRKHFYSIYLSLSLSFLSGLNRLKFIFGLTLVFFFSSAAAHLVTTMSLIQPNAIFCHSSSRALNFSLGFLIPRDYIRLFAIRCYTNFRLTT